MSLTTYDVSALADGVMHLLRTEYTHFDRTDHPFDLAWNALMDKLAIPSQDRSMLKAEAGRVLSKRPKRARDKKIRPQRVIIEVASVTPSPNRMTITVRAGANMLTLRQVGSRMVHTATEGYAGDVVCAQARSMAQAQFEAHSANARATLDRKQGHVTLMHASMTEVCVVYTKGRTEVRVVGTRGPTGRVRLSHTETKPLERTLDTMLRRIVKTHFLGCDSMPLPGM